MHSMHYFVSKIEILSADDVFTATRIKEKKTLSAQATLDILQNSLDKLKSQWKQKEHFDAT